MQCWDLMTTTTGNWNSAGVEAMLPVGSLFYKHPLGSFKHPSPAAIDESPALAFTTYVNTPNDNGSNNANTLIVGGFPGPIPSLGDATAPQPGRFSVSWGDLFGDPPGTYKIARLTFPQDSVPDVGITSRTTQTGPDSLTRVPDIPEPSLPALAPLVLLIAIGYSRVSRIRLSSAEGKEVPWKGMSAHAKCGDWHFIANGRPTSYWRCWAARAPLPCSAESRKPAPRAAARTWPAR
jgi:hypothetical protein